MNTFTIPAVPAVVVDLDENDRIIAECDENLCGSNLTPAEKAEFTAARKKAYLAKHPETAAGVAGATARHGDATENFSTASFADDTAARTGVTARKVCMDADAVRGLYREETYRLPRGRIVAFVSPDGAGTQLELFDAGLMAIRPMRNFAQAQRCAQEIASYAWRAEA
jgi:hypothetical protein